MNWLKLLLCAIFKSLHELAESLAFQILLMGVVHVC